MQPLLVNVAQRKICCTICRQISCQSPPPNVMAMLVKLALGSSERLVEICIAGPHLQSFLFTSLGVGPNICSANQTVSSKAADLGALLCEHRYTGRQPARVQAMQYISHHPPQTSTEQKNKWPGENNQRRERPVTSWEETQKASTT